MAKNDNGLIPTELFDGVCSVLRRLFFRVLSYGPMPRHIAFIMDGNRRYGKKHKIVEGETYQRGYFNFVSVLRYCYEMGVGCVSAYAFSIDNFKRKPTEVQLLMDLLQEKLEALIKEMKTVNNLGIRVVFIGRLELLDSTIRVAMENVVAATSHNSKLILLVCIAYTSTDEILRAIQSCCNQATKRVVSLEDIEFHLDLARYPDPDILIRTSGETRLSNFLTWQTSASLLHSPKCFWPEFSLRQLVWAVLEYQRKFAVLEKVRERIW